jgi:hypothetical protein
MDTLREVNGDAISELPVVSHTEKFHRPAIIAL